MINISFMLFMGFASNSATPPCQIVADVASSGRFSREISEKELEKSCGSALVAAKNLVFHHSEVKLLFSNDDKMYRPLREIIFIYKNTADPKVDHEFIEKKIYKFLFHDSKALRNSMGAPLDQSNTMVGSVRYSTLEYCFDNDCEEGRFVRFFVLDNTVVGFSVLLSD